MAYKGVLSTVVPCDIGLRVVRSTPGTHAGRVSIYAGQAARSARDEEEDYHGPGMLRLMDHSLFGGIAIADLTQYVLDVYTRPI